MSGHVYVPFEHDSDLHASARALWQQLRYRDIAHEDQNRGLPQDQQKKTYSPLYLDESLRRVRATEVIYIFAHGKKDDDRVYGNLQQSLTAVELARQVEAKELKKSHEKIKLWVCHSGYGARQLKGAAYKFWEAMDGIGYNNLTVYGYTTQVSAAILTEPKTATIKGFDEVTHKTFPKGPCKVATEGDFILPGNASWYRLAISRDGIFGPQAISNEDFSDLGKLPLPPYPS